MQRITEWLARHPLACVLAVFTLTAAAAVVVVDPLTLRPKLGIDASVDNLLPASSEDRAVYERVRALFGESEAILVAVTLTRSSRPRTSRASPR